MSDERKHCMELALGLIDIARSHMALVSQEREVADIIQRERAGLLARVAAAEAECLRLKLEVIADLRAKVAAAEREESLAAGRLVEARADFHATHVVNLAAIDDLRAKLDVMREDRDALLQRPLTCTLQDAIARAVVAEVRTAELEREAAVYKEHSFTTLHERLVDEIARAERAEAAVGQMRAALEGLRAATDEDEAVDAWTLIHEALATDAGRGYMSPEQVAQACAAARDAALEEACKTIAEFSASTRVATIFTKAIRALKVTP